jgi:hypothetical protein
VQRGGFASERDVAGALERELERLRRERRRAGSLTLGELVEVHLVQHDVDAVTIEKLRWLLGKAVAVSGDRPGGGYLDLHNLRNREWKPAQRAAGIEPPRRVYDLRHTFATFALRAGISSFDLSRYMGASLTMIDRHYGHLARDGREHAIRLLDELSAGQRPPWTLRGRRRSRTPPAQTTRASAKQGEIRSPLTDSNRLPPPYHGGFAPLYPIT